MRRSRTRKGRLIQEWDFSLAEKVILVTGMPGAGKDEFIGVAIEEGFTDFHMGNVVRKHFELTGQSMNDSSVGKFASSERNTRGMDIWARRTMEELRDSPRCVIEGLRNYEELESFKKSFSNSVLIGVFANREERFSRILNRRRKDDATDINGLMARDERELSWGIGKLIALSDYMVINDSDLDSFRDRSRKAIQKVLYH
ncbi:MAG: flagellar hook-basal body complex protein FliE [Candidatus Thermoplasmatota archaeon]|nr:flagellar hook-basal body complex protein FliE [Candidatus Thermoplasmatota archaeon]MCL5437692.1 flagellar hook-basal body complex protein FliE [Candidatus Thermoplasmatota archaeon]